MCEEITTTADGISITPELYLTTSAREKKVRLCHSHHSMRSSTTRRTLYLITELNNDASVDDESIDSRRLRAKCMIKQVAYGMANRSHCLNREDGFVKVRFCSFCSCCSRWSRFPRNMSRHPRAADNTAEAKSIMLTRRLGLSH